MASLKKKVFFLVILSLIILAIFWNQIKDKYFILAYKENCLISLLSTNSNLDIENAKLICSCIINKIKLNDDILVTSKLHVKRKVKNNEGQYFPVDKVIYRPKCVNNFKNKNAN